MGQQSHGKQDLAEGSFKYWGGEALFAHGDLLFRTTVNAPAAQANRTFVLSLRRFWYVQGFAQRQGNGLRSGRHAQLGV